MNSDELRVLIAERLAEFYQRRIKRLEGLKLKDILESKNPYLFKAIGKRNANEIIEGILLAYLSSSDEGIFGRVFFEPIAMAASGGIVSPSEGVDIAIETPTTYKAISVKSGPNPFNASQQKRQDDEFRALRRRLSKLGKHFDPILGHAYGRHGRGSSKSDVSYRDVYGQEFWEELTDDPDFYLKLIRLMDAEIIKKHRDRYVEAWENTLNRHVGEFITEFCDSAGAVQWEVLVRFNSGRDS